MKTKKLLPLVISFFMIIAVYTKVSAQPIVCVDTISQASTIYVCGDTLKAYTNTCAAIDCWWIVDGAIVTGVDTVTITISASCSFHCAVPPNKNWNVSFITNPPNDPWIGTTTTTCGILHAQPGAQPGTTYLWSTGSTYESIVTAFAGNYSVTVTNACGVVTDNMQVIWTGSTPSLGPDNTVCYSTTLTPGTFSGYVWTGGSTGATLNVTTSGTYAVTVTNSSGCKASDNVIIQVDTAISAEMCYVTFDTITLKNRVDWFVDPLQTNIDSIRVEIWQGAWISIGSAPYTTGTLTHWGSSPQGAQYTYRAIAISPCGLGAPSELNVSIWLSEFSNELQWQNYIGPNAPTQYTVRAITNVGTILTLQTVFSCLTGGCMNHWIIVPNPSIIKYFVSFPLVCSQNKTTTEVMSNYWDLTTGMTQGIPTTTSLTIYPNPTTDIITIAGVEGKSQVDIYDISGRLILHTQNAMTIDLSDFAAGMYTVKVITETGVFTNKVIKK